MGNVSNQAHIKGSSEPIDKDTMVTILKLRKMILFHFNVMKINGKVTICIWPNEFSKVNAFAYNST